MSRSRTSHIAKPVLLRPKRIIAGLRTILGSRDDDGERKHLVGGESLVPRILHRLSLLPQLEVVSLPASDLDDIILLQSYARMAQDLRLSMPSTCRWPCPEDVKLVGEHPIAAGAFANIWEVTYDGCKAVLKSYRCYISFDVAQVVAVRRKSSLY